MPACLGCTCMLVCALATNIAHGTAGAASTRHSLLPPISKEGTSSCKPRAQRVARPRDCIHRHCERSEAIHFAACGDMDCFVAIAPRNDGDSAGVPDTPHLWR